MEIILKTNGIDICYNADSVSVITKRLVDSEDYCVVICGAEND